MNKLRLALLLTAAGVLTGCSSSAGSRSSTPSGGIPQVPPIVTIERPGRKLWEADFMGPSIGLGIPLDERDDPDMDVLPQPYKFATHDRPAHEGRDCVDPGPNEYYTADFGLLELRAKHPGFPVVSRFSIPRNKPMSIEADVACWTRDKLSYGGICLWNGEMNYRAIYYVPTDDLNSGRMWLAIYSTTYAAPLSIAQYPHGVRHKLRIDYDNGTYRYFVNDKLMLTEVPRQLSSDKSVFSKDPHPALWVGNANMLVTNFNAFGGDKQA